MDKSFFYVCLLKKERATAVVHLYHCSGTLFGNYCFVYIKSSQISQSCGRAEAVLFIFPCL